MKLSIKYFLIFISLSFFSILALTVNYAMPSYDDTIVTGMEVRRMDKDGIISKSNPADGQIRDVYFLFTENSTDAQGAKEVMVYRNEDTGWGLPPYFKFSSADLQAKAQAYANERQRVQIKYYGWRIKWLNEFPNIVSIKPLAENETKSMPFFSYVLYAVLLLLFFLSIQMIRGWFDSSK
ncbi:hypothetical protein A6046_02760 [[Haemophilus] ducreyi]|uniref:DUF1523 domain-containing protein n=2 Tax=Haemophilus ducreyi TaxID=730 RepID=Q7VKH1_HAEDU|nr:DUF1523 family protein [[Haemophilus] ducreyi]AAP96657.1 hypothetical protein HD_1937 [[Haemophilus] ducreyi 35000HP]AKO31491.1 hypothetical protein RY60_07485 [[Haemophilus] ducreyi]AKO32946.1 hypothetical protein RZ57_07565 [[Haemophilus] ducreyi]AKO34393.1 hypothetical protein RZ58_07555 [[Haemophilus] ducreyi]AKO35838.1 hypothetical protein RZ59_07480 [[Haemophilus] ducreyi]